MEGIKVESMCEFQQVTRNDVVMKCRLIRVYILYNLYFSLCTSFTLSKSHYKM